MDFFNFFRVLKDCENKNLEEINIILKENLLSLPLEKQKLFVFFADNFLIKKYKNAWSPFLLEWFFFDSSIGGEMFIVNLKIHIEKRNIEMVNNYLYAIKSGFYINPIFVNELIENIPKPFLFEPEETFINKQSNFSLNNILIIVFFLCIFFMELISIYIRGK